MRSNNKILQFSIVIGYIIVLSLISCVIFVLFHERNRMKKIEQEAMELRMLYRSINAAHTHVTELTLLGESVMGWDDENNQTYQQKQETIDSLLRELKNHCGNYIVPEQIDTLRDLLAKKEEHLLYIRKIFLKQMFARLIAVYKHHLFNADFGTGINGILNNRFIMQRQKSFVQNFGCRQISGR